jgi:hypothetical protein
MKVREAAQLDAPNRRVEELCRILGDEVDQAAL